jgi:hypothetical protein
MSLGYRRRTLRVRREAAKAVDVAPGEAIDARREGSVLFLHQ